MLGFMPFMLGPFMLGFMPFMLGPFMLAFKICILSKMIRQLISIIVEILTFNHHKNLTCKKLSRVVGIISRLSPFVPSSTILTLNNELFLSHLSYGIAAWGGQNAISLSLQASKINILPGNDRNSKYYHFKILPVAKLYSYFCFVKLYNRQRSNNNLILPIFFKSRCQQSFVYNAVKFWNVLPVHVKNCQNIGTFKHYLRTFHKEISVLLSFKIERWLYTQNFLS